MSTKVRITPLQISQLKQEGLAQKEMARIFGVTEQTIIRWKKPATIIKQKPGPKPKADKNISQLLTSYISKNNTITQQATANFIAQQINQSISQQTISRLLKKNNITYKKLTYHYTQLDENKARVFNEEIKPLLNELPFIALDECSFYPNLDPRFGYSLKGKRAVSQRPNSKGEHYTLLLAISNSQAKGVVHWKLTKGKVDWKVFYDFLAEIKPIGDKKNILLMDNAKIHLAFGKRKEANIPSVSEQMMQKNIQVKYLTPYAPMLNPTELCFNKLRQQTERKRSRNYQEMEQAIAETIELLNKQDLTKDFWHCANYFDNKKINI